MKYVLILSTLLLVKTVQADSSAKGENLKELMDIMNMNALVEGMYSQMEIMMQNMAVEHGVKPSEQALSDEYFSRMMLVMREEMGWEKMEPKIMEIYSTNFSEKEIADMLSFYKTETGQAVIAKLPLVTQESMLMSQELAKASMPKIQKISLEFQEALNRQRAANEEKSPVDVQ